MLVPTCTWVELLCPVSALLAYLAVRPPNPGPLFVFDDGTPLSRVQLVTHLCKVLSQIGEDVANFSATVLESVLRRRRQGPGSAIPLYRLWAGGNH